MPLNLYFSYGGFLGGYHTIKIESGIVWHRFAYGGSRNDDDFETVPA